MANQRLSYVFAAAAKTQLSRKRWAQKNMNEPRKCRVHGYSLTCAYLWQAAEAQMIAAKTLSRPRETYFLTCRVMCAFTLEAYLNHAGSIVDSTRWAKERRFFACNTPYPGTRGKMDFLIEHTAFTVNKKRSPYQTLCALLSFRDIVAHGRTEWISQDAKVDRKGLPQFSTFRMRKEMSYELAQKALRDTKLFLESFQAHLRLKFPDDRRLDPDPLGPLLGYQTGNVEFDVQQAAADDERLLLEIEQALTTCKSEP